MYVIEMLFYPILSITLPSNQSQKAYSLFDHMTNWNFHYEDMMFNIGFWTQSPAQMTTRRWSNILLWFRGKISGRKNVKTNLHFLLTFCLVGSSCFLLRFVLFFSFYFSRRIVFSYTTLIGWFNCTDHPIRKQKCTVIFIFLIIDRVIYL